MMVRARWFFGGVEKKNILRSVLRLLAERMSSMAHSSTRVFFLRTALLFVIALIPLALYVLLTPSASANLKEIAQRTANEFDRLIQLRQHQVFTIAAFPSIRAFAASAPETRSQRAAVALNELQAWVAADPSVREAFIVDKNGVIIMTTLEGWNSDVSARQFVQDALAGQIAVSPIAQDRGEFSNYYAAPILNNEGEVAGALAIRVAAQELWQVTPRGENFYAVLSDEFGARLDDSGDPARRLETFAPLDAERAARLLKSQRYGAQLPQLRATNLLRAQQLITQGALDQLRASDFNVGDLAAQRLVSKPWSVLILTPQTTLPEMIAPFIIPVLAALLLALAGAFLLQRL